MADTGRPAWYFTLGIGLIPCPISTTLIISGLLNQMLGVAIFLVVGISIGGMIAMTFLSLALIGGKKMPSCSPPDSALPSKKVNSRSVKSLDILALSLMIVIGSVFFLLSYLIH